jgi:hypothetical protein
MGYARSATTYSPYAYVFTAVSCGLWIRYAVDWGHGALGALSWIGAALAAVYVVAFLFKAGRNDPRSANLLCFAAGGAVLLVSAVGLDLLVGKGSFVYNAVCCGSSCFASGAPAYNLVSAALRGIASLHIASSLRACSSIVPVCDTVICSSFPCCVIDLRCARACWPFPCMYNDPRCCLLLLYLL